MDKRGESQYISWIIVLAMVVGISFLLYNWSIEQAKKTGEALEASADPVTCQEIGFIVEDACQTFRSLELNVTNTNSMEIQGFIIRTVGLYPEDANYLGEKTLMASIRPGQTERVSMLKKGTLGQAKIVPIAKRNDKNIYCEEQAVVREKTDLLQC